MSVKEQMGYSLVCDFPECGTSTQDLGDYAFWRVVVRWRNPVGFPRSQRLLAPVAPAGPAFADGAFDPGPGPGRAA
ncbi:hypothetical protein FHS07_001908 [Microbacterium proteolyticum]|uniref:Uncharacterized protein n=1 Tax=Microbacterium proteolyticum TaxID=1572644 RepID=A0A7W5CIC2_9MICO|nr:hypothetical protein [Microbacterium proteolyticum]MBB3158212.1 hypothetical protein [Microbacterium proteolyticum]